MKVLFLPNWEVMRCNEAPKDKQPPDYYEKGKEYWFFRYFEKKPEVDIIDVSSAKWIQNIEKNKIRFYVIQALKAIPRLNKYDLIISHGMQSGVVISLWRRLFRTKSKHIVFDIGAFNSAAESGAALKLMQFASRSIDGFIYHTSSQIRYYEKFFPWIVDKAQFIRFGTDAEYFSEEKSELIETNASREEDKGLDGVPYCICVGYSKRDWDTVIKAFELSNPANLKLLLVGHVEERYKDIANVEQMGFVSISELKKLIIGARFGILPLKSYNYSYGQMTLLQQMAMGKCVIASRVPSLVDYYEEGVTAISYEPENAEELADTIKRVNSNGLMRNEIGKKAAEYVKNISNECTMAKEIEFFFGKNVRKSL
ncbi:glycosyltransferase family 4 protein [Butyrivibrio sp. AE3003]|uniref:glycosyltransferase family 4 protein n=1 Tax=Butyrivibrio sp. AE3003 TaxID=1496721 RepID=UPI00047C1F89|nr:glycosyltransferase family 4 protein [Butyrivibrio sp. AE3003]